MPYIPGGLEPCALSSVAPRKVQYLERYVPGRGVVKIAFSRTIDFPNTNSCGAPEYPPETTSIGVTGTTQVVANGYTGTEITPTVGPFGVNAVMPSPYVFPSSGYEIAVVEIPPQIPIGTYVSVEVTGTFPANELVYGWITPDGEPDVVGTTTNRAFTIPISGGQTKLYVRASSIGEYVYDEMVDIYYYVNIPGYVTSLTTLIFTLGTPNVRPPLPPPRRLQFNTHKFYCSCVSTRNGTNA